MKHKYYFILGANPTLSVAELAAVFGLDDFKKDAKEAKLPIGSLASKEVFIFESDKTIDAQELIKRLGGTIKIGEIAGRVKNDDLPALFLGVKPLLKPGAGKFNFGISYYGKSRFRTDKLAMDIKKYLRERKINSRWVTSREKTLSSVVVEQNKLASKGVEVCLIEDGLQLLVGRTLAVQPFKALSFRDYGRPARDDRSGMLPPKLAQIMINLAVPHPDPPLNRRGDNNEVLLDPFCGSGTILTEAMLMGYQNLIGADISGKAVKDTKANVEWVKNKLEVGSKKLEVFICDASKISSKVKLNSVDAIVTEPYLGPQRGKIDIAQVVRELEDLYSRSLSEFRKVLKPNGRVVMVFPVFHITHITYHITPDFRGFKIVNPVPKELRGHKAIKLTNRNTIVYGREGQRVWREIVVLE